MQVTSSSVVDTSTYDKKELDVDNDHGSMNQDDFMKLFITQLKSQDPMEPMDDSQMMQQTATFTQVELLTSMEESLALLAGGSEKANNQQMMMSASGFIGKMVEFEGSNTYLENGAAPISFDPESVPYKTEIAIYDAGGNFVRTLKPAVNTADKTTLYWDGTDASGNRMQDGKYTFAVVTKGLDDEEIDNVTYGSGLVTGVSSTDKGIIYEVDGSEVSADKVISVRDPKFGGVS
jgi:flagellar basal-body rod modification protein FlgD